MIHRIHELGARLRAAGKRMYPCLDEPSVAAFEQKHNLSLPEDYRLFLLLVGNGGDGPPLYGVPMLGGPAVDMFDDQKAFWTDLPKIRSPFPFTSKWLWEFGEEPREGAMEQVDYGSIFIGNDGCGQYWRLIATGPERGKVWQRCHVGILPSNPRRGFLQWYEDWLNGEKKWF